jgi:hypothetical protein
MAAPAQGGETMPIVPGRFGNALDPQVGSLSASDNPAYGRLPITVECWAFLRSKTGFNILVAREPKTSSTHWELYSLVGTGMFSVYLPGFTPSVTTSNRDITDSRWRYVAMAFDGRRVQLFVDGSRVADQPVTPNHDLQPQAGPLLFGTVDNIGCDGLVDEVHSICPIPTGRSHGGALAYG